MAGEAVQLILLPALATCKPFSTMWRRLHPSAGCPAYRPSLVEKCRAMTSSDKDQKRAYAQVRAPFWVQAGSNAKRLRIISGFGVRVPDGAPLVLVEGPLVLVILEFRREHPGNRPTLVSRGVLTRTDESPTTSLCGRWSVATGTHEHRGVR